MQEMAFGVVIGKERFLRVLAGSSRIHSEGSNGREAPCY